MVSFLRAPMGSDLEQLDADVAVMGVPTDEGSPYLPGSRFGPRGIQEMSVRYAGVGSGQDQRGHDEVEEDRRLLNYEPENDRIVEHPEYRARRLLEGAVQTGGAS